jgi:predicted phage terminase large subunit-like protein
LTSGDSQTIRLSDSLRQRLLAEAARRGLELAPSLWQRKESGPAAAADTLPFPEWLAQVTPHWRWDWPHLRLIQEKLQRVTDGACRYLMISCPPRHGKSESVTIRYPVWRMERDRKLRVCVGCYNQEFAARFGRAARRAAAGRFPLSGERNAAQEWETPEGGMFRSCGVGSPPTGMGFELLVIDDPVRSAEEAESKAYRDRVWEWYSRDLYTRREPGCAVLLIQTRWHEDDLAGRILASESAGQWEVVNLPALAEADDALGREEGEALCPERFDREALLDIQRTMGGYGFEALYQGRPTPREGSFFKVGSLQFADTAPAGLRLVRAWDLAATAGGGDYTAGAKLGADLQGRYYVLHVKRGQWGPDEADAEAKLTARLDGPQVRIRGAQDPGSAGKRDAAAWVRMLAGYQVETERVSGPKETRARAFASQVNAGNVTVITSGDWDWRAFVEELRQFPTGKHDDQVDGASDAFATLALPVMTPSYVAGGSRPMLDALQRGQLGGR